MRPFVVLCLCLVGCGPNSRNGQGDDAPADAYTGPTGQLSGRVWAPGLGPSTTAPGEAIPIAGAAVYVTSTRPAPIPSQVYCEPCQETPAGTVISGSDGSFVVSGPPGHQWLVIQKAQFRLEQEIDIDLDTPTALAESQTTLPSHSDPANGKWIPRIAVAAGDYDHLEAILGKMGLGTVDATGLYAGTAGQLDLVGNGGPTLGSTAGNLDALVRDPARLASYHIVFIPCSGDEFTARLSDQQVLKNLRDYVKQGGKLYVTDWSGEWMDDVFPTEIELGNGIGGIFQKIDTPAGAYNRAQDRWDTSLFGNADGDAYDSKDAAAVDPALAAWLNGQRGPSPESSTSAPINPQKFSAVDNWNYINALTDVQIGVDMNGAPVVDHPKTWVTGSNTDFGSNSTRRPMTVTFEPAGCGRVVYSTYHTTGAAHLGLFPQGRILLYLIMEIGVCSNNPVIL